MPLRNVWFWKRLYPLLRRFCCEYGVAFNRVVNLAVEQFLGCCDVGELRLWVEVEKLLSEGERLVRLQNAILKHGPYLEPYARVLVEGGVLDRRFRKGLAEYPGGVKAVESLERIIGRRHAVSKRLAELAVELLPKDGYELPSKSKRHLEPTLRKGWPQCPNLDNYLNRQYHGLPDRQYCSLNDKFVRQSGCWEHWNKGYAKQVFEEWVKLGRLAPPKSGLEDKEHG